MSADATERVLPFSPLRAKNAVAPEEAESAIASAACTDEQLLERLRHRDRESALTLFRRYEKLAFSIGYKILQDEGEAEDIVQEIFIRLCSEVDTFDGAKGAARTWIIQMIYRRAFDRRAYLHRRYFYGGTDAEEGTNTHVGGRNPEDDMIDRLTVRELKAAFSEISDRQRQTLELFFFEGMTFAEIAERLDEDVKNVRHHYYRGLDRLRHLARQMMQNRKTGR